MQCKGSLLHLQVHLCTFTITKNLVQCIVHWCVGSWWEPYLVPKSISPCWPPPPPSLPVCTALPSTRPQNALHIPLGRTACCTLNALQMHYMPPERIVHCTCTCRGEFAAMKCTSLQMHCRVDRSHWRFLAERKRCRKLQLSPPTCS